MPESFARTRLLIGEQALERLKNSRVCVFGVGGVGSYVIEALARSGVGELDIVDNDKVAESNINRQIIALSSTVGRDKVDVAKERILEINPAIRVNTYKCFYLPEESGRFDFESYDYVVDAIDTVTAKLDIIVKCTQLSVPIISSMGTGNKLDPTKLTVCDIYETKGDPLARVMRRELKKRGVKSLKVVYSSEEPRKLFIDEDMEAPNPGKRSIPGSIAFVPSVAGLIIAGEVVRDLAGIRS